MGSYGRLAFAVSNVVVCALFLFSQGAAFAQAPEPIVGTWNFKGANADGSNPFIAVMTFNLGGTTVEFDTAGTNSSASPGESTVLGKWNKTGELSYRFKEQNYIYDSSGNLHRIAIAGCRVSIPPTLDTLNGQCEISFYQCSVSECPGPLSFGPVPFTITGKRF
jgi:hypothetical protein